MSILIKEGSTKRDWLKLVGATSETALKSLTLGKDGFAAAISPLLRIFETLRGQDSTEKRATRLVLETISYSLAKTIALSEFKRTPLGPELEVITEHLLSRVQALADQSEIILRASHLENPATFVLFDDVATHLFHEVSPNEPKGRESEIVATFRSSLAEALVRIRARSPDYYSPVFEILSGPGARGDARALAWTQYRELLIRRFEDEPLFGEDSHSGVRLAQVYQTLRGYWNGQDDGSEDAASPPLKSKGPMHVGMLDQIIGEWLARDDPQDRIRLISGGPGSGKSTFAKSLSAALATRLEWRVVFVPLQRIKGAGPLEGRINEYFRLQVDEPFDLETAPLLSIGRDGHRDWLIVFDGLDELAKEGINSESAAQEFASALADWRGRIGDAAVRFLVLGRAPSMQDARRRLGLQGRGTIHVAGMAPLSKTLRYEARKITYYDPSKLREIDQRSDFWKRWAVAKGITTDPPEAISVGDLLDLTNEPLLAYLLILSGYLSERWQEAAENRNRIYQAIFNLIWIREREKPTRLHLNDLGQEGFEALLQALGLAAWRGGGRTGSESTFVAVRDNFMRPDLLDRAKMAGAAQLSNVALLFYTRKDEEGGRGYEFLHKSFGEYLTAKGLFSAFLRWGSQASDPRSDFSPTEFLRKWLNLAGSARISYEILNFLRNEVRLWSGTIDQSNPWKPARDMVGVAARLFDCAVRDGLPAHELRIQWREAEAQERNAEEALLSVLGALGRAAYPSDLFQARAVDGGWIAGPIDVPSLRDEAIFSAFLSRFSGPFGGYLIHRMMFIPMHSSIAFFSLSRLSLRGIMVAGISLAQADLEGVDFEDARLIGAIFSHSNLAAVSFRNAALSHANFSSTEASNADFSGADLEEAYFDDHSLATAKLSAAQKRGLSKWRRVTKKK
ncbi:NACHT domain-containing protein [Bradyrhizobium cosmicum]|uniref:NACHT domain-containing protein n=1 Tax=Bradyrhizobium cosmicum TaxID=1404864 RepID=A0AAI8M994_9BRAD|nr:pentapeptide repeat-containing protein [Bradyrhizobium cosmicum]BAL74194.1 hypothetical protein S23_09750 [Bradyrhizobium cosmicum]